MFLYYQLLEVRDVTERSLRSFGMLQSVNRWHSVLECQSQNISNLLPIYTPKHPRRLKTHLHHG